MCHALVITAKPRDVIGLYGSGARVARVFLRGTGKVRQEFYRVFKGLV